MILTKLNKQAKVYFITPNEPSFCHEWVLQSDSQQTPLKIQCDLLKSQGNCPTDYILFRTRHQWVKQIRAEPSWVLAISKSTKAKGENSKWSHPKSL